LPSTVSSSKRTSGRCECKWEGIPPLVVHGPYGVVGDSCDTRAPKTIYASNDSPQLECARGRTKLVPPNDVDERE